MAYKAVFDVQREQAEPTLGEDFDAKMMELLSGQSEVLPFEGVVKALPFGGAGRGAAWRRSWRPFYQAAGLVALILTIGMAAQRSFEEVEGPQQAQYAETDSMESPIQGVTPLPEQQAALAVEQVDTMNLTR